MSRIIIDVTQLVHWPGRLTGIPRVVQELAVRFSDGKPYEVVHASWVKEIKQMCEVDLAATLAIRGNGIEYVTKDAPKNTTASAADTSTTVATAEPPTPLSLKRQAKTFAKKVLRRAGADDWAVVKDIRHKRYEQALRNYRTVEPHPGDILFIGAGEWWDDNFIQLVERYHDAGIRIVQVSHDLLPIVTPQFAGHATDSLAAYNARVMPIASLVLAVSESTKRDLMAWLESKKLHVPRIETFRIGEDFTAAKPVRPAHPVFNDGTLTGDDFILCVGTIEARKNHAALYYVYKLAASRGVTLPKIVVVGRRGWKTDDIYEYITTDPQTKDAFVMLHDAGDGELSWLYDNCRFSVYPSFYEGWGMPIAESTMRGAVCIASDTSSMPEVAPGFALSISPSSPDELLNAIISLLQLDELEERRAHLKKYVPTYWDDSFARVLTLLGTMETS